MKSVSATRVRVLNRLQPLLLDRGQLVVSSRNRISRYDGEKRETIVNLQANPISTFLDHSRWLFRMRRSAVFSAAAYENKWFFSYRKKLVSYDTMSGQCSSEFLFNRGRGPLNFAVINGEGATEPGIYFGEYFRNHDRRSLDVLIRRSGGQWDVRYTFAANEIEHIHALVPDRFRDCVWILTGDYGAGAAIWRTDDGFRTVQRVISGSQQFRSCVAFPTPEGLLYATDSQLESNHIRLLSNERGEWRSRPIHSINGPSMYGCELASYYVFSTSTEPRPFTGNSVRDYLTTTPGPGIAANASDILLCRKSDIGECEILSSAPKDALPYRLFQFGTVRFPVGANPTNRLFAYFVGSRNDDQSTVVWDVES